jgi:hypothetical protein
MAAGWRLGRRRLGMEHGVDYVVVFVFGVVG